MPDPANPQPTAVETMTREQRMSVNEARNAVVQNCCHAPYRAANGSIRCHNCEAQFITVLPCPVVRPVYPITEDDL